MFGRAKCAIKVFLLACCFGLLTSCLDEVAERAEANATAESELWLSVPMTCFPAPPPPGEEPGVGPPPPCVLPVGIEDRFVSPNPSGEARFRTAYDGTTIADLRLYGLAPDLVVTAWIAYYFPGPVAQVPDLVFEPVGPGLPPVAAVSAPLAPTDAAYTNGRGAEPNSFRERPNGRYRLRVNLDYDLFSANQAPMRNGLSNITQALAPAGSPAFQPDCCPDGIPFPQPQAVASELLRAFDPDTGFQMLDDYGRPELLRGPVPVAFLAIVAHLDDTTHGVNPGIPVLPAPSVPVTIGDHFLIGLFDLRGLAP